MKRLARPTAWFVVACVLERYLGVWLPDSSLRQLIMLAAVNALIALSLNLINGLAGQFSLGHAGFVAVGAYASAVCASTLQAAWPGAESFARSLVVVPLSLAPAALLAGACGLLVGLPSLRLRGDYLAVVTLGFAEIVRLLVATASETGGPIERAFAPLGGAVGYAGVDGLGVPAYAGPFWVFGAVFVAFAACRRLKFSGWGRALRAMREDETAAAAVGVDPTRYKVTSFVLAALGAGVAGGLLATMRDGSPTTQPDQFGFQASFDAVTMVILGGAGSVSGAVFGALFVTFTVKLLEQAEGLGPVRALLAEHPWLDLNALRLVVYAALLVTVMLLRPEGLFGEREAFAPRDDGRAGPEAA